MTGEAAGDRIALLEQKLAQVEARLTVREDELDVRKLQHLYGYLIDKCLYNETVDLFTDDGEVRFFGGVWKGKEGIRRLYVERFQKRFTYGNNGPIDGFLLDHPQLQDIIDIQPDGVTALARALDDAGRAAQGFRGRRPAPQGPAVVGRRHLRKHLQEGGRQMAHAHPELHADLAW